MSIYTDLALEAAEMNGISDAADGIRMEVYEKDIPDGNVKVTKVEVYNENGANAIGKPVGNYITVESEEMKSPNIDAHEGIVGVLSEVLGNLPLVKSADSILVVGLGNLDVTPDALGPRVASKTLVTRHIKETLPEDIRDKVRPVSVMSPGVMGTTGLETSEIVGGIAEHFHPGLIIAIDALAARRASRINATIQIADTGLTPGSGMGGTRKPINAETLGIPVIAIGVPTVVDAATLVNDTLDIMLEEMTTNVPEGSDFYRTLQGLSEEDKYPLIKRALDPYVGDMFVTPKEVDAVIDRLSNIIANTINISLHPGISREDINRYMY